jgi:hypothetical protein
MADRPIIFSGPMVQALRNGRKTQTRRLASSPLRRVAVGDRLYVREAAAIRYSSWHHVDGDRYAIEYAAGGGSGELTGKAPKQFPTRSHNIDGSLRWCPSIHMPRWASRLTLIVEGVKVEPLQELEAQHPLESDAIAEGVRPIHHGDGDYFYSAFNDGPDPHNWCDPADAFRELWDSLHTAEGERWSDNPDVVALTFRVVRGNIDRIAA